MKKETTAIGIDLGGTKVLLEAFDGRMGLLKRHEEKTDGHSQKAVLEQLHRLIRKAFGPKTKVLGIAVPGIVNREGKVIRTPHLPLRNLELRKIMEKHYRIPVVVENDISAFLMAEAQRPALKKMKNLVGLMVGTGVGGAIIADGKLLYGQHGYAGEVGHIVIDASSPLAALEQKAGGASIPQLARTLGIKRKMTAYDLDSEGPEARKIKSSLIQSVGMALANLNLIFDPEAFVLGGSIYHLFLSSRKAELRKIVAGRALDGRCPQLIDRQKKPSVARGVAMMAMDSGH